MRVVGLISGTSIDGIDVAAARLDLREDTVQLAGLGYLEHDYPDWLRDRLRAALPPGSCTAGELCQLDTAVGKAFAEAAGRGMRELAGGGAELIGSLGQTIYHWVSGERCLGTLQLGQPAWIAEATGVPVVGDLRARDVAAGGHGAPLASTLDALWLRDFVDRTQRPAAAVNIGGIANITVVTREHEPLAYDTGPGNALLDEAARMVSGGTRQRDTDGALAERGSTRADLLELLLADPYYPADPPKSTGKERFNAEYLHRALRDLPPVEPEDLLRTLVELTARTIAREARRHDVMTVLCSGGGTRNPALIDALAMSLGAIELRCSDELGLPAAAKEAYLAALLGWLTWHGVPANLPSATGARGPRLLGSITPGRAWPAGTAEPAAPPRRLQVLSADPSHPIHGR
ncbi:MAG: anhydro-N-acetylmuramic acid kinase [Pseudonocardiaceae bacterium]|nr:anhydro-N-acetylmuramic acid kinase [Pseudonocardiaceae bacterium]